MKETRNSKLLKSFVVYCEKNPSERFWQALKNWAKVNYIYLGKFREDTDSVEIRDTYYFENKTK